MVHGPKLLQHLKNQPRNKPNFHLSFAKNTEIRLPDTISYNIQLSHHVEEGNLVSARNLFDKMPQRSVVSWNAMISGYTKWGRPEEALLLASHMHSSNVNLNETTFSSLLGACSRSGYRDFGKQIHSLVLKFGAEDFELVGSALLNMYTSFLEIHEACRLFKSLSSSNPLLWSLMLVGFVRCNLMLDALDLFERMPSRDVFSWTALISGFSRSDEECGKALELVLWMKRNGEVAPNEFTYDCVLRACGKLGAFDYGVVCHGCLIKCGFESDKSITGALIEFYCNCDAVEDARRVFDRTDVPCLSTCNTFLASLILSSRINDAEMVFEQMIERNAVSYNLMIKGYAHMGRTADSKRLYENMPHKNIVSMNTMMTVFHQNGELAEALEIFEHIKGEKNSVTWNSMISGYVRNDRHAEAIKMYAVMRRSSVECSRSTFSALFRACAGIGTLQQGRILHAHLCKTPFESNAYVGTSLVDMYAKCGSISDARNSFLHIAAPNVTSWTALINAMAHRGLGEEAILEFGRMMKHGIDPNAVTFVGLLVACGRAGMVNEGMRIFYSMEKNYGLVPSLEHYACVVDLLGRSGFVREAEKFIFDMPIEADSVVWVALLNACWFCRELVVGERVAERIFSLDSKHASTCVAMSNIYARLGRWEEVANVRKRLREMHVKKDPGCSWIEVKDNVHVFCVEDRKHPQKDEIYQALEELSAHVSSYSEPNVAKFCYTNHEFLISSLDFH